MKIVVFADSHRDNETMTFVVKKERPELVIHLGDHITDAEHLQKDFPEIPMEMVPGNTDTVICYPYEKTIIKNKKRIYITHGDRYNVQFGLSRIFYKGESVNADMILFGHTHIPYLENEGGIWMMNPGRIGRVSRNSIQASYGIILLKNDEICCSIKNI
ncbi:MAG TPA: YfcE family phosphodiesterase [Clostridiales bacterium]|nr:YfcE family phosphodiesterase [Clostridiales bacterium]